jgi:hypothetical protein
VDDTTDAHRPWQKLYQSVSGEPPVTPYDDMESVVSSLHFCCGEDRRQAAQTGKKIPFSTITRLSGNLKIKPYMGNFAGNGRFSPFLSCMWAGQG